MISVRNHFRYIYPVYIEKINNFRSGIAKNHQVTSGFNLAILFYKCYKHNDNAKPVKLFAPSCSSDVCRIVVLFGILQNCTMDLFIVP